MADRWTASARPPARCARHRRPPRAPSRPRPHRPAGPPSPARYADRLAISKKSLSNALCPSRRWVHTGLLLCARACQLHLCSSHFVGTGCGIMTSPPSRTTARRQARRSGSTFSRNLRQRWIHADAFAAWRIPCLTLKPYLHAAANAARSPEVLVQLNHRRRAVPRVLHQVPHHSAWKRCDLPWRASIADADSCAALYARCHGY